MSVVPKFPAHPQHHDYYMWQAIYNDNTTLSEVEGDTLHVFSHIEQDKLVSFILHPLLDHLPRYAVVLEEGQRLIFFRRRRLMSSMTGEDLGPGETWTGLGWQETRTVGGEEVNFKTYQFINENGSSFLSSNHNAI